MNQINQTSPLESYREIKIDRTIYRVTSVFQGEKNLADTITAWAISSVLKEIKAS